MKSIFSNICRYYTTNIKASYKLNRLIPSFIVITLILSLTEPINTSLKQIDYKNYHSLVKDRNSLSFLFFYDKINDNTNKIEYSLESAKIKLNDIGLKDFFIGKVNKNEQYELSSLYNINQAPVLIYINNKYNTYHSFSNIDVNLIYDLIKLKVEDLIWNPLTEKSDLDSNINLVLCGDKKSFRKDNIENINENVMKNYNSISLLYINSESMWNYFNCDNKYDIFFYFRLENRLLKYKYYNSSINTDTGDINSFKQNYNNILTQMQIENQPLIDKDKLSLFLEEFTSPPITELTLAEINKAYLNKNLNIVFFIQDKENLNNNSLYIAYFDLAKEQNSQDLNNFFQDIDNKQSENKKINFYSLSTNSEIAKLFLKRVHNSISDISNMKLVSGVISAFIFNEKEENLDIFYYTSRNGSISIINKAYSKENLKNEFIVDILKKSRDSRFYVARDINNEENLKYLPILDLTRKSDGNKRNKNDNKAKNTVKNGSKFKNLKELLDLVSLDLKLINRKYAIVYTWKYKPIQEVSSIL